MNKGITQSLHNSLVQIVDFSRRFAPVVVISAVLLTGLAAYYTVTNFAINTDTNDMIDPSLPFRQTYREFDRTFPQFSDTFIAVIDGETPEQAERAVAEMLRSLAERPDLFRNIYAPGHGTFFDRNGLLYLSVEDVNTVSNQLADSQAVLAALAEDPSIRGLFDVLGLGIDDAVEDHDAPDGLVDVLNRLVPIVEAASIGETKALSWQELFAGGETDIGDKRRFITIQPVQDFTKLKPAKDALVGARAIAGEVRTQLGDGLVIRFTGKIALSTEELESVTQGIEISGALSFILVAVLLACGLKSARLVFAALITLFFGLIWTAAFAILAIGYFNLISVAFAVLFIGLGIDFAIHFALRYQEECRKGADHAEALKATARGVGTALSLAAPTTAIAFYAFMPTAYEGLAQLGLISGTGIFISYLTSITLLPALLTLLPLRNARGPKWNIQAHHAGFVERHGRPILWLTIGAALLSIAFAHKLRFDFDPTKLKDPSTESVQVFEELLRDPDTSPYTVQIAADDITQAAIIAERLKALPEVDKIVTLASFVPKDQDEKLEIIDNTAFFMTSVLLERPQVPPPDLAENQQALREFRTRLQALAAVDGLIKAAAAASALDKALQRFDESADAMAYDRLTEALFRYFPAAIGRIRNALNAAGVTLSDLPDSLNDRYLAANGKVRVEVFPAKDLNDQAALKEFVLAVQASYPFATGNPVQMVNAGIIVTDSMIQATSLAGILIILLLFFIFRRIKDMAMVLLPVLLAGIFTAAATVWLNIPFNFANIIVLPLLIGLGVDSGIHLVMRARENMAGAEVLESSTPRAVLLSSLTTVGSFGSLALSSHRGTASMGELLTVSVVLLLICVLIVLPGLLSRLYVADDRRTGK